MAPKKEDEGGIIKKISSYFSSPFSKKEVPKTPVGGFGERMTNVMHNNFRGLLGVIVPLVVLGAQVSRFDVNIKMKLMWLWMVWFYLLQPIAVPCTSIIPVFLLPMAGIYDSLLTCKCYMNETILLYILSAYLVVLLNNSGVDKRIAFWFLCSGDSNSHYTGKKLVYKAATAAFFLSIFSSRLITTFNLTQTITKAFGKIEGTKKKTNGAPDVGEMRYIINNAIQTSSSIGGMAILHSSWVNILFRGCFQEVTPAKYENPDIFNYLQYSVFAFPVSFVMFIVNLFYHMMLMGGAESKGMTEAQMTELRNQLARDNAEIPKEVSLHETYSIIFTILILAVLFSRWNRFIDGWALKFNSANPNVQRCKDATAAAIFVILLHIIPKSFNFIKILSIDKKKNLPPLKPESAILWWRFVDKNVNYGYIFTMGSAIALLRAGLKINFPKYLSDSVGIQITNQPMTVGLLICILVAVVLCNIMTSMAACSIWLPFILLLSRVSVAPWPSDAYLAALSIGMASNLGFCTPFQYTPAYYCHYTGKVPITAMIKYSIPSVVMCSLIIYGATLLLAKPLWDPNNVGFKEVAGDILFFETATKAAETGEKKP